MPEQHLALVDTRVARGWQLSHEHERLGDRKRPELFWVSLRAPTAPSRAQARSLTCPDHTCRSSKNVGAIVGGVVGGVVGALALALVLLFFIRRRRFHQSGGTKERPVDLLQDNEHDGSGAGDDRLPEYYQPEPFVLPDPTVASSSQHDLAGAGARPGTRSGAGDRRESFLSTSTSDNAGGLRVAGTSSVPSTSAPPVLSVRSECEKVGQ